MKEVTGILLISLYFGAYVCDDLPCAVRQAQFGVVCVCNSSYCDTVERPPPLDKRHYYRYTTASDSPGFYRTSGHFKWGQLYNTMANNSIIFTVNPALQYQEILGFGGSFTDSAGLVVASLPVEAQARLIESYFGANGLEYNMGRVPVGMSDFSVRPYSYDEIPNDEELTNFNLVDEDYKYKIPLIQKAMSVSPHTFKLIGAPFTSPKWMKTNNGIRAGYVKQEHFHAWAKYHVKFLDAYANHSIPFWALTAGNEVFTNLLFSELLSVGTVAMPHNHLPWMRDHLAPQLAASNHSEVKLLILDDMRPYAKFWLSRFAKDPVAYGMIEGVALHWYYDWFVNASFDDDLHQTYPDKLIMYTESSANTFIFGGQPVELGSWHRAALYAYNIIENLNHWTSCYLDWNLALDSDGGPYLSSSLDAAVLVNSTVGEFYKNPIFYAIGHFSKFIPPGSRRVDVKSNQGKRPEIQKRNLRQEITARVLYRRRFVKDDSPETDYTSTTTTPVTSTMFPFSTPVIVPDIVSCLATVNSDNSSTVIVFNGKDSDVNVTIVDTTTGYITATVTAHSLNTFVYWPNS